MPRLFSGRNLFYGLVIILLISIIVRTAGGEKEQLTPVGGALRDVLSPVYCLLNNAGQTISGWVSYPVSLVNATRENERLRSEIEHLQAQLRDVSEIEQENKRLRRLVQWQENEGQQYNTEVASIIGRNPSNWLGTIIIDKGSDHGIRPNMTVISTVGLVGRVATVTPNTAEVLLITDPRSGVGAIIQNTRAPGIVEGVSPGSTNLRMNHLPANLEVTAGETVVTSGQGSIFPAGISIGTVVDVRKEASGLFKVATVKPYVDFNRLEEVLVIKA